MNPFAHPAFHGCFGVARRDITPPVGIYARNWGLASHDEAEAIHQPLALTALVIRDREGQPPLAIVAIDLGWWRSVEEEKLLAEAATMAGFPPERCLLALSHTHAGPSFSPHETGKPGGHLIPGYLENLTAALTAALREAAAKAVEGTLEVVSGRCSLAKNRELQAEGRPVVGWNPAAPGDDTLLFGRVTDATGRCIATLVNYACHPTILAWENKAISPDFVGSMREVVEEETGAPCLFLQGASGDLAPAHQYTGDLRAAERAGRMLGHAALALWHEMLPPGHELAFGGIAESGAPLGLWHLRARPSEHCHMSLCPSEIALPLSSDLPSAEAIAESLRTTTDRTLVERLHRLRLRREAVGDKQTTLRPCLTAQLGAIALVAISDEAYSGMQVHLRAHLENTPLLVLSLVNRNLGYLVPEALHGPEHYASRVSPYAAGSFEIVQAHLREQLNRLPLRHAPGTAR